MQCRPRPRAVPITKPHIQLREIMQDYDRGMLYRITADALRAIQEVAEEYVINLFDVTQRLAIHRGRQTIKPVGRPQAYPEPPVGTAAPC